jgi:hypothetical protein
MPRTGVFLSSYDELQSKEDLISTDHVNDMREAPVVLKGYPKQPFSVDALLRWLEEKERETNPLSNKTLPLNDMQPVLTPDNRSAYKSALVKLARYGWDDASQIEQDAEAYSTAVSATRGATCLLCSAGTFSTGTGMASSAACANCVAGAFSAANGSTACSACNAGAFGAANGASTCTWCAPSSYSNVPYLENVRFRAI